MSNDIKRKNPFGFYVCSLVFTFERMAYYSVRWMLAYYIVTSVADGGLGLSEAQGAVFHSQFSAAAYIMPVLLGFIADRYVGARHCVSLGLLLMGAGYIAAGFASSMTMMWVMLILVAIGTGLFKGNLTAMIGRLFFNQEDLDAAFSTYYSFVNVGSFLGTTIVAALTVKFGYGNTFIIYGCIVLLGLVWYLVNLKHLGNAGIKPFNTDERIEDEAKQINNEPLTKVEKNRIIAIVGVSAFSIIFWLFWYLAYLPVYYHWETFANWNVGSVKVPTSWFDSLNAFWCIALGPILAMLWAKLAARPQGDISLFKKTAIGLGLLGSSYLIFAFAEMSRGDGLASIWWIALMGTLLSLGEMFFSPLGNSFISKYAPARYLSVLLGVWICAAFVANLTYGFFYNVFFNENTDFVTSNIIIAAIAIGAGALVFALDKKFNALLGEEK